MTTLGCSFKLGVKVGADGRESTNMGERALGLLTSSSACG
jgi:hypothetical protein